MEPLFDGTNNSDTPQVRGKVRRVHLISFNQESNQSQDATQRNIYLNWVADFSTFPLHVPNVDEVDTQIDLETVKSFPPLSNSKEIKQAIPTTPAPNLSSIPQLASQKPEEMYSTSMRKLIKSSGIYALASAASPLITLLLAPFLTRNLSHTDYGALAVLNTALALLAGLTQLGLSSAFFRAYNYDYESRRDRFDVLSTVIILLFCVAIFTAFVVIIAAPLLATLLFKNSSLGPAVRLIGVVALLQNLAVPGLAWLRAENRPIIFSMLSVANFLTSFVVTIIFVGILHKGIMGSLIGTGSGYTIVVGIMLPVILIKTGLHLRLDIAKGLLSFGLPNVSTFVSVWVLQLSDRFLLGRLGSLSQTATYAVAYSLGGALGVIVLAPFTLAWPSAMFSIAKRTDATSMFKVVFRWYSIVLLLCAFGLSVISTIALNLFFPPSYHSSALIIPIIALSIVFYGVYNIFTTGISIQRKTWFAVIFTTTAALVNVGLNLIMIPHYGSMGAALSTLLAYALLALIAYLVNQRIYPIPYEIGIFMIALFIGFILYAGAAVLEQFQKSYWAWGVYISALILYTCCLTCLWILPTRHNRSK